MVRRECSEMTRARACFNATEDPRPFRQGLAHVMKPANTNTPLEGES